MKKKPDNDHKRFTELDDQTLLIYYKQAGAKAVASLLGRSVRSIHARASKLRTIQLEVDTAVLLSASKESDRSKVDDIPFHQAPQQLSLMPDGNHSINQVACYIHELDASIKELTIVVRSAFNL